MRFRTILFYIKIVYQYIFLSEDRAEIPQARVTNAEVRASNPEPPNRQKPNHQPHNTKKPVASKATSS